ncbi:MAG TPA: DEAD/DEAH box helicase, partial [Spirochaetota bacterium]|nr:DEAD/DEAH box helicase [Spirochaetota bacterium]
MFFGCILNEEGAILEVEAICFGNDDEVLAPYDIVQRYNAILHNHPSGDIKPSYQDMEYAKFLQKQGIGFFITNNGADKLNTVTPPVVIFKNKKINEEEIREVLSPNGVLSKNKEDFEFREGQIEMSIEVAKSFNDNRIAILEAGTGTGKSLAYLIPAYLWAKKNNERVVISTNTINLQSQILNKDIPIVKKILNSDINAVLIKGRKNY